MNLLGHYNYFVVIILMMIGFYILISQGNLVKKVVGLNIFQTSVIIFYVSAGKIIGGTAPVLMDGGGGGSDAPGEVGGALLDGSAEAVEAAVQDAFVSADSVSEAAIQATGVVYSNPLPHVLMLTAIVVGVATMAVAFAMIVRIKEFYGTIEDDDITRMDLEMEMES
jgi:multicomponent Na+:H+ antiporter subunit C